MCAKSAAAQAEPSTSVIPPARETAQESGRAGELLPTSETIGLYYVATGPRYYAEACCSARSARELMPDLKIAIYTDQVSVDPGLFDVRLGKGPFRNDFGEKIQALSQTPFSRTLFVDTDTYFCADCRDVYELLKQFDLAVAHEPARETYFLRVGDVPAAFPELNTGVLGYCLNDRVLSLFKHWLYLHDLKENRSRYPHDQPTFRKALFESSLRFSILPPEYNARLIYPAMLAQEVKIIHARCNNLPLMAKYLNRSLRGQGIPRIYTWSVRQLIWTSSAFFHLRKGRGW